ncbi:MULTISPECIES: hypothetical protein [Amycolatopsis]|uniref:Uncharacterized protein n=1 Tax=Amycolatopsis thermalba TaxID=944492 RepID=A0ABY4NRQ7_9PSEU|nr:MULTISPECIES: hypothetical protein [Amycolatopsis]OXM68594.1 hypothetical protein CF166_22785 [Amycolatopsis sp. KNN50.9b]UQS22749.1 hypothetical protein L1857_07910 [Amycolatopsis thermalba]
MPIRTNRGRAAVYRRIWGFPLRSPAHLVGTAVAVIVLIVAIGIVVPQLLGNPNRSGPTPVRIQDPGAGSSPTSAGSSPAPMSTRLTAPLLQPTSAAPDPAALRIAKQWATAWATHPDGITNAQWLDGLRPLTTEEYLPEMSTVDPANIPATRVTGEPTVTKSYTSSVEVLVPTDGPKLSITVAKTPSGWLVTGYDQAS